MNSTSNSKAPLDDAIRAAGSQQKLADTLGIKSPSISQWRARGVPARRCLAIEQATGVDRYRLRPDVFGKAPEGKAA